MPREELTNGQATTLAAGCDASQTTITVAGYAGFPASGQFRVKVNSEIMLVTGGHGTTTWTVTRGQEGTVGAAHVLGAAVTQMLTAGALDKLVRVSEDGGEVLTTRDFNFTGQVGVSNVGGVATVNVTAMDNPMTTEDDLLVAGASGAPTRLAKGSNGEVLKIDGSGHLDWAADVGFANPMTTEHDLLVGGAAGAPGRLGKGANLQHLKVNGSGALAWLNLLPVVTADVSNPPTDAELDSAIGAPGTLGTGYAALVDDNNADANVYLVATNGTSWWYVALTKAV